MRGAAPGVLGADRRADALPEIATSPGNAPEIPRKFRRRRYGTPSTVFQLVEGTSKNRLSSYFALRRARRQRRPVNVSGLMVHATQKRRMAS